MNDIEVEIIDCQPLNIGHEDLRKILRRKDADVIGITSTTLSFPSAVKTATMVKEESPNSFIAIGGPHVTAAPETTMALECFDAGVYGEGSMVTIDKGGNRKENLHRIENSRLKYLTARQLNKSDENTWIKNFDKSEAELVDERYGVYGLKKEFPSRVNYMFFSEHLYEQQIEAKLRKVERLFVEAEKIQQSIENNRKLPKKYRINNPLVECEYSYQTKLATLSESEAKAILKKASITGREGFFCLVSNKDLTLREALSIYRQKDSIEKIFHSLKNEVEIKPLRCWSDLSIYGALIVGFLAQLFISLMRFEHKELKHTSPKFIKISLMNLTLTVEYRKSGGKRHVFSNFNPMSQVILGQNQAIT